MKKLLLSFLLLSMLTSCSEEQNTLPINQLQNHTNTRSVAEAVQIANLIVNNSGSRATLSASDVAPICNYSSRGDADTLIYAVNYGEENGFVLVSAAYNDEPVIGYTENGVFDEVTASLNPNFNYYLENAKAHVASVKSSGPSIGDINPIDRYDLYSFILQKLEVKWGQKYPEGLLCPNGTCGCVQTAMAQMMSWLEEPTEINLTYPEKDKEVLVLDWKELKKHKQSINSHDPAERHMHLASCELEEETHLELARLCRELGFRNEAVYFDDGETGVFDEYLQKAFLELVDNTRITKMKYLNQDYNDLYESMGKNGIAFIAGGGHAWVCDGGEKKTRVSYVTRLDGTKERVENHTIYFHYNWGWSGDYDGYFSAGVFDVSKGKDTVTFNSNTPGDFSYGVRYYIVYKKK